MGPRAGHIRVVHDRAASVGACARDFVVVVPVSLAADEQLAAVLDDDVRVLRAARRAARGLVNDALFHDKRRREPRAETGVTRLRHDELALADLVDVHLDRAGERNPRVRHCLPFRHIDL